uniref:(California timema) hypothetical protein n=1 Tax=Timema californicum TaxID=61474 RepID=A0A7R9J503_TIMCA|nr:unnamed protein product [Timema californicum]
MANEKQVSMASEQTHAAAEEIVTLTSSSVSTLCAKLTRRDDVWCVDSGATTHMCRDKNSFLELTPTISQKDGRNNKSKDKTEYPLNHASTSQEECIEPSLIEIGDKDNDESTNYLSQNQLIFREDVAALLKQIQTSSSCNQLETREPFKNLKSSGPKPLSLASTSFEQTKLSLNTKSQVNESLKCQKPINLKSVDLTSLKITYSSSNPNPSEGDENPHFPRPKSGNFNSNRWLVPVLYKLNDSELNKNNFCESKKSNETDIGSPRRGENSILKDTLDLKAKTTPVEKSISNSNKEPGIIHTPECSQSSSDESQSLLDSTKKGTPKAHNSQAKKSTKRVARLYFKGFESGVEKESYPEPPILLPNTLETPRESKITLDTSSKSTCVSHAEENVSELESKNQIDEVDAINESDLENTSQEILDDLVKHVAKKKRKTNNGKVKDLNQSFQWRFVKKVTDPDGQERYQCTLCKKSYASKWYLKEHLKIHTGEKNFGCGICDKRFRNNYMLNAHIRLHTGIKNFHCSFCPKKFYNNFDLVHHERHHTGEKPFKCKYCDKAFAYKRAVEIHMRTHTGERPYPCFFCSRTFIDKNQQVRHHRVHTGDRPYSCNLCGLAFKQISALCSHRRVHTDERPYSCSTCDLSYKWKSDLVKHFSTYHSDLIASVVKTRIEGDENASQLIDEAN